MPRLGTSNMWRNDPVFTLFLALLIFSFFGLVMCETFIFGLNFEETEDMHRILQFFVTKLENYHVFANDPADLMQPGGEHFGMFWAHVQTILASTAVSTNGIRAWAIMVADLLTGGTGLTPTEQGSYIMYVPDGFAMDLWAAQMLLALGTMMNEMGTLLAAVRARAPAPPPPVDPGAPTVPGDGLFPGGDRAQPHAAAGAGRPEEIRGAEGVGDAARRAMDGQPQLHDHASAAGNHFFPIPSGTVPGYINTEWLRICVTDVEEVFTMWDVGRCPFSLAKAVISITKRHYVTCVRCFL